MRRNGVALFESLNNPEVMGYEVARKASEIAEFLDNLEWVAYDTYATHTFSQYVESLVRGYKINEMEYDGVYITTTLNLHYIEIHSMDLAALTDYIERIWYKRGYFDFARENGLIS